MRFEPIGTREQIEQLATMADEIWHEYWPAIIGKEQTDYMVDRFQSENALMRDIQGERYEYWFLVDDDDEESDERIVGYTGGLIEPETKRFFISKIYLFAHERGKGYSKRVIKFYNRLCIMRNLDAMYLTVNKHNDIAIRAYEKIGFAIIDSVETDIGDGFIMDDYIMEKNVEQPPA